MQYANFSHEISSPIKINHPWKSKMTFWIFKDDMSNQNGFILIKSGNNRLKKINLSVRPRWTITIELLWKWFYKIKIKIHDISWFTISLFFIWKENSLTFCQYIFFLPLKPLSILAFSKAMFYPKKIFS